VKLAFYDQLIVPALDTQVFDGSIRGGQNIFVEHACQGIATDGNFSGFQGEHEGILIVKHNDRFGFGGKKFSLKSNHVNDNRLAVVIRHILHGDLNMRIPDVAGLR
jgi:hypothetical protein